MTPEKNAFSSLIILFSFSVVQMISLLPEEWKPGETMFGCPWQAVVVTALIGVITFTVFFWRNVLAVSDGIFLLLFLLTLTLENANGIYIFKLYVDRTRLQIFLGPLFPVYLDKSFCQNMTLMFIFWVFVLGEEE